MQPGVPRRQHTVTEAILRKFTDPETGQLEEFNLNFEIPRPKSPRLVGFVWDFVEFEQAATEQVWKNVEDDLPVMYAALTGGSLHQDPRATQVARDVLALHDVRSRTRKQIHEIVLERSKSKLFDIMMEQKDYLSQRYYERCGYFPAGDELFAEQARIEVEITRELLNDPEFFRSRLLVNFEENRKLLKNFSVEVIQAGSKDFMICDDPAVRIKHGYRGLGPLTGVAWDETNALVMPVSPKFAISMAPVAKLHDADHVMTAFINRIQLSNAHERVFYKPSMELRALVKRAPAARRSRPEGLGPTLIDLDD